VIRRQALASLQIPVFSPDLALPSDDNLPGEPNATRETAAGTSADSEAVTAIWRLLRRLGVSECDVEDATQEVFLVVSERQRTIEPGKERAFRYGVALRVARFTKRRAARANQELNEELEHIPAADQSIEEQLDHNRARALLDALLQRMPESLREVFVLFELEDLSTYEIAEVLDIPRGTVASRLRRARIDFESRVQQLKAQFFGGAK
jgi:RNA polymerase sigma-70 factor (ECF subfamily)